MKLSPPVRIRLSFRNFINAWRNEIRRTNVKDDVSWHDLALSSSIKSNTYIVNRSYFNLCLPQIVRLLRVCRTEMVRQHLVMTIMRPVYHGWRHIGALEEIWSSIANAVSAYRN